MITTTVTDSQLAKDLYAHKMSQSCVYILRFDRPLGSARHKAQYYCGFCVNRWGLERRVRQHQTGQGAAITRAAAAAGIPMELVYWQFGTRQLERKIKAWGPGRWLVAQQTRLERQAAALDFIA